MPTSLHKGLDKIRRGLRLALLSALREGRRQLVRLNRGNPDQFIVFTDEAHGGDPQDQIDVQVRDAFEDELRKHLPTVRVVGEESVQSVDMAAYPVAVLDPVDGTKPYRSFGDCWAVAAYINTLRSDVRSPFVPIAAICTASGVFVEVVMEESVQVSVAENTHSNREIEYLTACYPSKQDNLVLACVAAKPKDSDRYERLRRAFPEATVFNVGGNPVVPGVLTGDLDGIVSFHDQAPWDALYALAVQVAGGTVGLTTESRLLKREELLKCFRRPAMGKAQGKKVWPLIAAKDEKTYRQIFDGLSALSTNK